MDDEAAIERRREQRRRWNRENRDKMRAIQKRYIANHREQVRADRAEYYQFNKKRERDYSRRYYRLNRDQVSKTKRDYYERTKRERLEEERRISERMEAIEREAVALFSPNPETFGQFKIGKAPERKAIGLTPARTVALRLTARGREQTVVGDGVGEPCRGGGPPKGKRGRRQAIVTVVSRRGVAE